MITLLMTKLWMIKIKMINLAKKKVVFDETKNTNNTKSKNKNNLTVDKKSDNNSKNKDSNNTNSKKNAIITKVIIWE